MDVKLIPYHNEEEMAANLIIQFWQARNLFAPSYEDACHDLIEWTKAGHFLYFIHHDNIIVGFVHLFCGGSTADCHADVFVMPEFLGKDIDIRAIALAEDILKEHFKSQYAGADPETVKPLRLYHKIGYSCESTITARKSFQLGCNKASSPAKK